MRGPHVDQSSSNSLHSESDNSSSSFSPLPLITVHHFITVTPGLILTCYSANQENWSVFWVSWRSDNGKYVMLSSQETVRYAIIILTRALPRMAVWLSAWLWTPYFATTFNDFTHVNYVHAAFYANTSKRCLNPSSGLDHSCGWWGFSLTSCMNDPARRRG